MTRNFDDWLNTFRPSIASYDYYIDFNKVYRNATEHKRELHLMNSLIGSKDIENEFRSLVDEYPKVLTVIPTLLAVRQKEIYAQDADGSFVYDFKNLSSGIDSYCRFMRKTGLFDLIANHIVNNLYDYATGVEVGLDSNGRKGRGGHVMENLVSSYLMKANLRFNKEIWLSDIENTCGIDLSALSNNGTTNKRFDFVVKTESCVYGIETNFYASNGSKLNETARSYKMLAIESKGVKGFKFIWFTDGLGWKSASRNLYETFVVLEDLYNISDLESGVCERIFR